MSKAIKINPFNYSVSVVDVSSYEDLVREMNCQYVQTGAQFKNGDLVIVDEEGLLKEPKNFFSFDQSPNNCLAGIAIVIGEEYTSAKTSVEFIEKVITFQTKLVPPPIPAPEFFSFTSFEEFMQELEKRSKSNDFMDN